MVSAVLARNVYINFGRPMFPNLYCILVSPTGMRKTTTLQLVTISPATCFRKRLSSHGVTSNQAVFLEYLAHPDKLWLIDEDVILENWAHDAAGKQVARQVLTLHGCPPWRESYIKHKRQRVRRSRRFRRVATTRALLSRCDALDLQLVATTRFFRLEATNSFAAILVASTLSTSSHPAHYERFSALRRCGGCGRFRWGLTGGELRGAWVSEINRTANSLERLRQPRFHANFGRIFERPRFRPRYQARHNSVICCGTAS